LESFSNTPDLRLIPVGPWCTHTWLVEVHFGDEDSMGACRQLPCLIIIISTVSG